MDKDQGSNSSLRTNRFEMLKQQNFTLSIDEDDVEATVGYPGMIYDDCDASTSTPCLWNIMKIVSTARYFAYCYPLDEGERTFRDYTKLTAGVLQFLVTSEISLSQDIHKLDLTKCPFNIKIIGGYVGNTSRNSITKVFSMDGHLLATNTSQVVMIDKTSRRPCAIPEWWKSKYSKLSKSNKPLRFSKLNQRKEITPSVYKTKVNKSDTDLNNHTNSKTYARFAFDAIEHCYEVGGLPSYKEKRKCGLKKSEILYLGESFQGDELEVKVWECPEINTRLVVHIYNGENLICQLCLIFFSQHI